MHMHIKSGRVFSGSVNCIYTSPLSVEANFTQKTFCFNVRVILMYSLMLSRPRPIRAIANNNIGVYDSASFEQSHPKLRQWI